MATKISKRAKHRAYVAAKKLEAIQKFFRKNGWVPDVGIKGPAKVRKHKEFKPKRHDEHGSFTQTGRNTPIYGYNEWDSHRIVGWHPGRRVWVAGVSGLRPTN